MESPWVIAVILGLTSLGFVVSLAWSDAVKSIMDKYYPTERNNMRGKLTYAIIVTTFMVILAYIAGSYSPAVAKKIA